MKNYFDKMAGQNTEANVLGMLTKDTWFERLERLERVLWPYVKPKTFKLPYKFTLKRDYIYKDPYVGEMLFEKGDDFWEIEDQPTYYSNGVGIIHGAELWTSRDVWEPHFK